MTSLQEAPRASTSKTPLLPLAPWLAGLGILAVHGLVLEPPAFEAGRLLVAVLALLAAGAPFLHRWLDQDAILEAGLVPLVGLVGILPVPLRTYQPRLVVGTGLALVVAGYFLLRFGDRLERAHGIGEISEGRRMAEAWRFAWIRVGIVTGAALVMALVLTQVPRLAGAWISERWMVSVDAVSVHAVALVVLVFLAAGTGITLLRLARAAGQGGEHPDEGTQRQAGDGSSGAPEQSQVGNP